MIGRRPPPCHGLRTVAVLCMLAGCPAQAESLAERLEPLVGRTLDVIELRTGKRFVRPTLERVVVREGKADSLRIRAEGETRVMSLRIAGIARIVADREAIHAVEPQAAGARLSRARARQADAERKSRERMRERGVAAWPVLGADEHAAEVAALEAFAARVTEVFPDLRTTQTHEFIVVTDVPEQQIAASTAALDGMHDVLCDLYGIPRGEPVWKGKCLVFAFLDEEDFIAFERRFMGTVIRGPNGLCHQQDDGRVVMACHRGDDPATFAHLLVHETSHGFNHRWVSPVKLPNWLNEGIAEWVGSKLVASCNQVPLKEAQALAFMRRRGTLGADFFTAANIDPIQYGIASGMVRFLADRDLKRFGALVRAIKEGVPADEALRDAFGVTTVELAAAYGQALGIPGLKP